MTMEEFIFGRRAFGASSICLLKPNRLDIEKAYEEKMKANAEKFGRLSKHA